MEFLENNKFFSNNHYAFIAGKSTEDIHFAANNYIKDSLAGLETVFKTDFRIRYEPF